MELKLVAAWLRTEIRLMHSNVNVVLDLSLMANNAKKPTFNFINTVKHDLCIRTPTCKKTTITE